MSKTLLVVVLAVVTGCWTEEPAGEPTRRVDSLEAVIDFHCFKKDRTPLPDVNPGAPAAFNLGADGSAIVELTTGGSLEGTWQPREGKEAVMVDLYFDVTIGGELWLMSTIITTETLPDGEAWVNYKLESLDRDAECWGAYDATVR